MSPTRLKSKPQDFLVREILREGYLRSRGRFRVYRVTKRKRTTLEAAGVLARQAGVDAGKVGMAGLKDRQGVTTQYMSVPGGRPVRWRGDGLTIDPAGFADEALTSRHSEGNEFEVVVRDLSRGGEARLRESIDVVREHGLVNYFGEQRFGNLRSGQGWIARDLALGHSERALRSLLVSSSANDDPKTRKFKAALAARWGDWRACREIAGVFGAHHSVFEHLARHHGDFTGAFRRISPRIRLIHLYAWQSHLWNRAVARHMERITAPADRLVVPTPEGPLVYRSTGPGSGPELPGTFRLPGPGLEDVEDPEQRELFERVLRSEGLRPRQFRIEGVPGFQLKGEDRPLVVVPRDLRAKSTPRGLRLVFSLPRGAYAMLVVKRLMEVPRARRRAAPRRPPVSTRKRWHP